MHIDNELDLHIQTTSIATTTVRTLNHKDVVEFLVFLLFGGGLFLIICVVYAVRYALMRLHLLNKPENNQSEQQSTTDGATNENVADTGASGDGGGRSAVPDGRPPPPYSACETDEQTHLQMDLQADAPPPYVLARSSSYSLHVGSDPLSSPSGEQGYLFPYLPGYEEATSYVYNSQPPLYEDDFCETHM